MTSNYAPTRAWRYQSAAVFTFLTIASLCPAAFGQVAPRITQTIDSASHVALRGTVSPRLKSAADDGKVSGNLKLAGLSLVFTQTAAQQADLKQLLTDQQTPGASSYHRWLTPAQYAARFGVSDADVAKVENWLTTQGFTVSGVNQSHTRISFSGSATQVESAFSTELHHYTLNGETHLANATELQVPSALAGIAAGVTNVSDFRPKPHVRRMSASVKPRYTSSQSGDHYVTPADVTTIYDIQPLYTAGYTGSGQRLAIVGQSEVLLSDIANFRAAAGLAAKAPIPVLVPNTGTATVYSGDEAESDLDLEYSGAVATNADIYFVYVGSDQNSSVFDSLAYAIDTDLAPVISISYGSCEANYSSSEFATLETLFQQANSQGQTIFSATGDSGATDCDESSSTTITSATHGLAVDYPASSQYVTGVGGTMFNEGSGSYWNASSTTAGGSAISYIPEEAWNETTVSIADSGGLTGGGGGASTLTTKPSWQTGTGVPSDGQRDVPDIALNAAVYHDSYLYCSSDTETDVTGSCSNGFRDSTSTLLTAAGGTSFAAPIAAGMLALVNQKTSSSGQGNLNPTLYALATSTPSAFHDITVGDNKQPCTTGTTDCASGGTIGYSAGTGYDQATGLGSLDASVFSGGFTTSSSSSLLASTTTLTPGDTSVTSGTSVTISATVAATSGTPSGTVQFAVDGTSIGTAVTLTSGVASYSFSSTSTGSHVVSATYSGDASYASSYAVDTVTVTAAASSASGSFTLAATTATAALGGSGTSTITVTPAGSYTGTIAYSLATSDTTLNEYGCYDISDTTVASGATTATATLTVYTAQSQCSSTVSVKGLPLHHFTGTATVKAVTSSSEHHSRLPGLPVDAGMLLAGTLCWFFSGNKRNRWMLTVVFISSGLMLTLSGCGGTSTTSTSASSTSTETPAGTYTLTLTGTDTTTSTITATTTTTLTIT